MNRAREGGCKEPVDQLCMCLSVSVNFNQEVHKFTTRAILEDECRERVSFIFQTAHAWTMVLFRGTYSVVSFVNSELVVVLSFAHDHQI
jgi:hypothetical protein